MSTTISDEQSEQYALEYAAADPRGIEDLFLSESDFTSTKRAAMWRVLCEISQNDGTVTADAFSETAKQLSVGVGVDDFNTITNNLPLRIVAHQHARRLRSLTGRRRAWDIARRIMHATEAGEDFASLLSEVEDATPEATSGFYNEREMLESAVSEIMDQANREALTLGWEPLVKHIGRCPVGSMIVVGARPNTGKTTLCLEVAQSCAERGTPTLMVSVEDPRELAGMKYLGRAANIDPALLRDHVIREDGGKSIGSKIDKSDWPKLMNVAKRAVTSPRPIHYYDAIGVHIRQIVANVRAYVRKHKVKIVCVDYIQTIRASRSEGIRVMTTEIARDLKRLAAREGFVLVLASQLKRVDGQDYKMPNMSDLKETSSLEEMAEAVLMLWKDSAQANEIKCVVSKLKWAGAGAIFSYKRTRGGKLETHDHFETALHHNEEKNTYGWKTTPTKSTPQHKNFMEK